MTAAGLNAVVADTMVVSALMNEQAYLPGWPAKIGMFQREVLPVNLIGRTLRSVTSR